MWFRGMTPGPDGLPMTGRSARSLGIRVPIDIAPDAAGNVHPHRGGMSVAPESFWNVPNHRRPRGMAHGSTGPEDDFIYAVDREPVELVGLAIAPDANKPLIHAFVEPAESMALNAYEEALLSTRPHWSKAWP